MEMQKKTSLPFSLAASGWSCPGSKQSFASDPAASSLLHLQEHQLIIRGHEGAPLSFIRTERRMGFQISGKKPAIFWVHSWCWVPPVLSTCEHNKEITNYLQVLPQNGFQEQIAHTAEGLPCLLFSSFATKHILVGSIKSCYLFCVNSQGPAVLLFIA